MEVNPPAPTTSAPGAAWRSVKIQVTASRMFTVDILPEESVQDVERLILSKVARQGLQLTAIKVVEADSEEGSVSVGDDLLPSAVKGTAVLHMFNPDTSYPARNRLRPNQPNIVPLWQDDNEPQSGAASKTPNKGESETNTKQNPFNQQQQDTRSKQLSTITPQTLSGLEKLEDFSSAQQTRHWDSTALFRGGDGEDGLENPWKSHWKRVRAKRQRKSIKEPQALALNAGFARRAARVGMANALEHRSKRASKRVQKKLGAAAQKRWQGKSLTDDAKIDAINQALEKM